MSKLSILFPEEDRIEYNMMPEETWHDLGLDTLAEKVAKLPQESQLIRRVMTGLTADPAVTAFRADVFDDILRHPEIREQLLKLLKQVKMFYDYGVVNRHEGDEAGIWDLMHRLEEYHDYVITVEAIRNCLSNADLRSDGLKNLKSAIDEIYAGSGFAALKSDVESMRVQASQVRSLTVGINLNDRFEAVSMGLVTVNGKPFTQAGLLKNFVRSVTLKDDIHPEADWNGSYASMPMADDGFSLLGGMENLSKTYTTIRNPLLGMTMARVADGDSLASVPRQADSAATMLVSRTARRLRDTLGKYVNISVKDIADLIPELVFYTRWAEYIESLTAKGWQFCKPETAGRGECPSRMEAEGFYNLKLIGTETPSSVIPNDLTFDAEKRVYILTGANRGGKTTVTQALGQLFLLAQSGIRVPAVRFVFDPADSVMTHFPADEDKTLDLGRLGEECKRFRECFARCTGSSLLLLNETFSTTSFEEGYYIAVDAVKALLDKDIRTVYNTHMHKLAYDLDTTVNTGSKPGKAISLVAETKNGAHSFRVRIAPPEGQSFARDIAEKYGVTYELLSACQGR
ncbi:MAG: DNA mismatch repair protein [Clostridia bacterium]|nr:DNA mismatch repair protein [Clostridia bacterium]